MNKICIDINYKFIIDTTSSSHHNSLGILGIGGAGAGAGDGGGGWGEGWCDVCKIYFPFIFLYLLNDQDVHLLIKTLRKIP